MDGKTRDIGERIGPYVFSRKPSREEEVKLLQRDFADYFDYCDPLDFFNYHTNETGMEY